jgi:hypothetical protein
LHTLPYVVSSVLQLSWRLRPRPILKRVDIFVFASNSKSYKTRTIGKNEFLVRFYWK